MTNMEIKREALEMDEMGIVSGGTCWLPIKNVPETDYKKAWCGMQRNAALAYKAWLDNKKRTKTFACEYDKEDMEYLEDILDPEDLYNCFAV